jgi:3-hydroxyacyl-CoA dehydrogenase
MQIGKRIRKVPVVAGVCHGFIGNRMLMPRQVEATKLLLEGAKILEEGIAQRASDIDVVWVYGYGWPVYRGGPMFWADTEGPAKIVEGLKRQEERMGSDFTFSQLLLEKAEKGEKFTR